MISTERIQPNVVTVADAADALDLINEAEENTSTARRRNSPARLTLPTSSSKTLPGPTNWMAGDEA